MKCTLHPSNQLIYFCQTCIDPICQTCSLTSPHSDTSHHILPLQQSISNRQLTFSLFICNKINPLRQIIKQKMFELKTFQQNQLISKNIIMKDILLQFQGIDQRTKQKIQKKKMQYQTQIKYYQNYLNIMDDLAYTFQKTCEDPYNFLLLYQDFNQQLKHLQLKEIKQKLMNYNLINIVNKQNVNNNIEQQNNQIILLSNSIPRQIKSTYQQLNILQKLRQRNKIMSKLINKAVQNGKQLIKKQKQTIQQKHKQSLLYYNNINQKILSSNFSKTCIFCEVPFCLDIANDSCLQNKGGKSQISKNYLHIKLPQKQVIKGSKRHYWVDSIISNRKIPDINAHALIKPNLKRQFQNSLRELIIIKCYFKKYQIQNNKQFIKIFQQADKDNKGILSKISFKFILIKVFGLSDIHAEVLTELLRYNWKSIKEFQNIINRKYQQKYDEKYQQKDVEQIIGGKNQKNQKIEKISVKDIKIQQRQTVNYKLLVDLMDNFKFPLEQYNKIEEQIQKSKPIAPQSKSYSKWTY